MYGYIARYVPSPYAEVVTAIWFLVLIVAIVFCSTEPSADFRYGRY